MIEEDRMEEIMRSEEEEIGDVVESKGWVVEWKGKVVKERDGVEEKIEEVV